MKNLITIVVIIISLTSCSKSKDYVTFYGKVKGCTETLTLESKKANIYKTIKVNDNGIFRDTLKLEAPTYLALSDGKSTNVVYFKNGDKIKAGLNTRKFNNAEYKGKGAEESNYMSKKAVIQTDFFKDSLFHKSKEDFNHKLAVYTVKLKTCLAKAKDSIFKVKQAKYIKRFQKRAKSQYKFKNYLITTLSEGTPATDFSYPYEDKKGAKYTLEDLSGQYIYIKFWATWCGYCKKEVPFFKDLAEKYKDQNIKFIGVSIDQKRSKKAWKKAVEKSAFQGLELFSGADKKFIKKYKLGQIPRFILIDPDGNIIDADAPYPSNKELDQLLDNIL